MITCDPAASTNSTCSRYARVTSSRLPSWAEKLISAGPRSDPGPVLAGEGRATGDQLLGGGPVQAHIALRGVHRLGNPEPVAEEVLPERQGGLPIDHGRRTWNVLATGIRDDVGRSKRDSAAESLRMFRPGAGLRKLDLPPAAAGFGQRNYRGGRGHGVNRSIATRRPSAEDVKPASASCKPRTPAARS